MVVFLKSIKSRRNDDSEAEVDAPSQGTKKCEVCLAAYSSRSFPQHRVFCARLHQAWLARLPRTVEHHCEQQHNLALWPEQQVEWACTDTECGQIFPTSDGQNRFTCYQCGYSICSCCLRNGKNSVELEQQGNREQVIFFPDKRWIKGFAMTSTSSQLEC